jgi:hypothetical protein
MPAKQSSAAISSIAARVLKMRMARTDNLGRDGYNELLGLAKALAGSVLSQDETKGDAP